MRSNQLISMFSSLLHENTINYWTKSHKMELSWSSCLLQRPTIACLILRGCLGLLHSTNSSSTLLTLPWSSSAQEFTNILMCLACNPAQAQENWLCWKMSRLPTHARPPARPSTTAAGLLTVSVVLQAAGTRRCPRFRLLDAPLECLLPTPLATRCRLLIDVCWPRQSMRWK